MSVHPLLSQALVAAQAKFGESNVYVADEHKKNVFGVTCPMAFGWLVGGSDKVPLRRIIGCDGPSGSFKSALMMEHARWFLCDGGLVILIDTEEKVSDTLVCGMLFKEDLNARMNYVYAKATSVEQAQELITHFKSHAAKQVTSGAKPEDMVPWLLIWDSLTGRDTKEAQDKIAKEGHAQVRAYADAASSIARFYKGFSFGDELVTLAHVQHVGKNMDDKAVGDEEWKPKGGDEPKYSSTYHFRITRTKAISSAKWEGKELTIKCIKSGLGPDKRKLDVRILWEFVWVDQPVFEGTGDDRSIVVNEAEAPTTRERAQEYYNWTQQSLSGRDALILKEFLGLDDPKKEKFQWPLTERIRFQRTWWDWDWALGNLLVNGMKYNEKTPAATKADLDEALHFVKGPNTKTVKCEALFGSEDSVVSLEEFGRKIQETPDVCKRISSFLGISHYAGFRDVVLGGARAGSKRGKKGG